MKIYYCSLAWKCPKNKQSAESLALIFISHYCHSVTYLSVSQYDRVFWQWHFWAQRTTSADYSLHIPGRKTTKWAWCWVEQHVWNLWQTTHKHTHEKKPRGSFKVKWNERETKRVGEFGQKERREINWKGREYYGVLQEFFRRRKEKKTWVIRKGIVLRAVVFLSVLLFKGTVTLMALPYTALGFKAGAQHCTVPKKLELQGWSRQSLQAASAWNSRWVKLSAHTG